ncbi:MFS general substrate transporter [Phlegmacium glaucopus]|nr:MFS general substrate transporter [Phlegmacium glaucopus]
MTGYSLLPTAPEEGPDQHNQSFKGISRILGPKWAHLPTITSGLLGVQIFWSIEISYASPYLLSLGLSKSSMAVVFIAGPLSGLIMQPLIGILADNCTSSFGRRRPYMLLGTLICAFAMLLLGFTRPVASIFTAWDTHTNNILTIWLAILAIYLLDFSINAVQAVDRALLIDTLPRPEQASANAWAARMLGTGSVIGFFIGNIDLPYSFPFLGHTQLQVLSVIGSLLLVASHLLMAGLVKESVLVKNPPIDGKSERRSFSQQVKDLWSNLFTLPKVIRQICIIQFFAWIAWFPVLFYTSIYVGDLYKRSLPAATTSEEQNVNDTEATRLGSRALFYSALLSLTVNLVLPAFVAEAAVDSSQNQSSSWWKQVCSVPRGMQIHLVTIWAISHLVFAGCMFATFFTHSVWGATFIITVTGFSWAITQWAPFALLADAIKTESTTHDDVGSIRLADTRTWAHRQQESQVDEQGERDVSLADDPEGGDGEARLEDRRRVLGNSRAQLSRVNITSEVVYTPTDVQNGGYEIIPGEQEIIPGEQETNGRSSGVNGSDRAVSSTLSSKSGVILGIHNIFIVIPQFLVSGFAAILFAIIDPQKPLLPDHRAPVAPGPILNGTLPAVVSRGKDVLENLLLNISTRENIELDDSSYSDSVVYIFRFGGLAASLAFILCWRLAREIRHR